jgi:hypothetical protein
MCDTGRGRSVAVDVEATVEKAWASLPAEHRQLLEVVGADQHCVVYESLGDAVDSFRQSAGLPPLTAAAKRRLAKAFGAWIRELRIVLINGSHPDLFGLSPSAAEAFVARLAWHEWGHALSIERCSRDDVFDAEAYALLMERRQRGVKGQPAWLNGEIYALVQRVTGWTE